MKKLLGVAFFEYGRHVFRKRFLLALLSVPAFIFVMVLVVFMMVLIENRSQSWGFVDNARIISTDQLNSIVRSGHLDSLPEQFPTETQAREKLLSGDIEVYFVIEEDYADSGNVRAAAKNEVLGKTANNFTQLMQAILLIDQSEEVSHRLIQGHKVSIQTTQTNLNPLNADRTQILVPFIIGFMFMITVFISSGYLMQAVVEEKENRTVEVLVSAVTNNQLMIGKIIGIIGVGVTQILLWGLIILVGLTFLGFSVLGLINSPSVLKPLATLTAMLVPAFVIVSALMAAIGAVVNDIREGQQYAAIVTFPVVIPYMVVSLFMSNPNGTVPTILSYFPLTAPIAITLRFAFTSIPESQLISIFLILVLSAGLALWFSGRAFRIGYMNYDGKTSFKKVLLGID
ncbi:MAG: ABC transporter permease [Chloroflexota bacterium]|nr:ABC transporter permease [Chloroflexota bacterium]